MKPPRVRVSLVLDQGVPRDAATLFREAGFECVHVAEEGMSRAEDTQILEYARQRGGTVLTLDADFHAILASSGASGPSVIRIRKEGLDAATVFRLVEPVVAWFSEDLASGCMITVKPPKISRHRLPVAGS